MQSVHFFCGCPTFRLPVVGFHRKQRQLHLSSQRRAICPARVHLAFLWLWTQSLTLATRAASSAVLVARCSHSTHGSNNSSSESGSDSLPFSDEALIEDLAAAPSSLAHPLRRFVPTIFRSICRCAVLSIRSVCKFIVHVPHEYNTVGATTASKTLSRSFKG